MISDVTDQLAQLTQLQRLTVQWHITDRCNLRCSHCYQDSYRDKGPDLAMLKQIAQQIFTLHQIAQADRKAPLQINLTGGEPCVHPDFPALLEYLSSHPSRPSLAILSNGALIDTECAALFARLQIKFVQLSVEGNESTHDAIRGRGHFQQVLSATHSLKQAGVRVLWSFTAHDKNYQEFNQVAELAHIHQVDRIWSDRMLPSCHRDAPQPLDTHQSAEYFQQMYQVKCKVESKANNKTEIAMFRALQFQAGGNSPYYCNAGKELITLMPDGSVLPCRRMPINVGNVQQQPLAEIYYQSTLLQQLRNFSSPEECSTCLYRTTCQGGLRCLAYAKHQTPFRADPACSYLAKPVEQNQ